jgi:CheY-like chemotaxis protein
VVVFVVGTAVLFLLCFIIARLLADAVTAPIFGAAARIEHIADTGNDLPDAPLHRRRSWRCCFRYRRPGVPLMDRREAESRDAPTLIVDDHPLFRLGFVAAWRLARPHEPIVEASDLDGARRLLTSRTRLVVVDLLLPDGLGLELAASAVRLGVPFVVLSTADAPAIVEAVRRSGAAGFFSKETDPQRILLEIDRILSDPRQRSFPARTALPR